MPVVRAELVVVNDANIMMTSHFIMEYYVLASEFDCIFYYGIVR